MRELPTKDGWAVEWESWRPAAQPPTLPDRKDQPETLLVHANGSPLIVRQPRRFGFRPEDAK